jgi:hypothetical protein
MAAIATDLTQARITRIITEAPEVIEFPDGEPLVADFPIANTFTKAGNWELVPIGTGGKSGHTIRFVSNGTCDKGTQFVYMIVIDGSIAKIGGSKNTVKDRIQSYNCGVYSRWRGGSGKQSVTNSIIYDSIELCLLRGRTVELYVHFIDIALVVVSCWDIKTITVMPTVYDVLETCAIRRFYELYGKNPIWSKNGRKQ